MAPSIVAVIGALNADLIMRTNRLPDGGESMRANDYQEALGGKGANAAIATFRTYCKKPADIEPSPESQVTLFSAASNEDLQATLKPPATNNNNDIDVRMIGAVGDDKYADFFDTELKRNGVDASGLRKVKDKRSGICFVVVEEYTGENRCLFTMGATETWNTKDFITPEDLANGVRPDLVIAQMEIHKEVVQQMIETAGNANIDFLLNAAPADPITMRSYRFLTHLLVNESEAAIMSGRELHEVNQSTWPHIAKEFLDRGVRNVVITLGAKGAYYATADECDHVPGYKVEVVDSTGAGDTFTGAYASEYLQQKATGKWDIKSAIIRANKAAALTVGKRGAQEGIPWRDEIDAFEAELNVYLLSGPELDGEPAKGNEVSISADSGIVSTVS